MKISELIEKLREIAEAEGDINVTYRTDDYFHDIDIVAYCVATPGEEERVELI